MMADNCNPSTQRAEAGRFLVPDQPGLHRETLSQKDLKKKGPTKYSQSSLSFFFFLALALRCTTLPIIISHPRQK
jgi:hypothetical protein